MASRSRVVYLTTILLIVALSDVVSGLAFNITKILEPIPDLRVFNELLSRTKVADLINSRRTITVLVADNRSMEALTRLPLAYVEGVLMANVLLDYFDVPNKLDRLVNETTATNLFQTTGVADQHGQGYVVVNRSSGGEVMFRAQGQTQNASKLVDQVFASPYDISVLRLSDVIVAPGMLTRRLPPPPPPPPAVSPAPSHAPSPGDAHAPAAGDESPPPGHGDDEGGSGDDDSDAEGPTASGAWAADVGVAAVATVGCLVGYWFM